MDPASLAEKGAPPGMHRPIPPAALQCSTRRRAGLVASGLQVVRDVRHDHAPAEEQRALDDEGRLVVEKVLPPPRGHELGQDDGYELVAVLALQMIQIVQE